MLTSQNFNIESIERYGDGTVQEYIHQHSFFDEFTSDSVGNLRITTVMNLQNKPSLRSCYLRLGQKNDQHVKSENHIRIPIDLSSGKLFDTGYLANWQQINMHPQSNILFANKQVPCIHKCIDLVLGLHMKMPMVQCIGWDLAINDQDQPVVMEWNGYGNDIKFSEATQGPCFKDLNW